MVPARPGTLAGLLIRARWLLCLAAVSLTAAAAPVTPLAPNTIARTLAGLETAVPPGVQIEEGQLRDYARAASERWKIYERRIGTPMLKWAQTELTSAPGATVFYPFSGPDFATVQRLYPDAARYVLVALQRGESVPALETATAAEVSAFLGRFAEAWKQFAQVGFFRTLDLDEEAKQAGLRAGVTAPLLAFAVRSGYTVLSVEPVRVNASGTELEPHPGPRSERATWNSVRITLAAGSRKVILDYVRMNLADASLGAHPEYRAWIERMTANRTVLKAASHLLQSPRFAIVRDALLERAPSIVQDETGIDYGALARAFNVKLYGHFSKPHKLFNKDAQRALAEAYQSQPDVKALTFRVSYQRQSEANLQVATRLRE